MATRVAINKIARARDEFKAGTLHSGSKEGPVVTNPKQAFAIGLSEQRTAQGLPRRRSFRPR